MHLQPAGECSPMPASTERDDQLSPKALKPLLKRGTCPPRPTLASCSRRSYAFAQYSYHVMAGLVPAIHETAHPQAGLAERDARNESGHDVRGRSLPAQP